MGSETLIIDVVDTKSKAVANGILEDLKGKGSEVIPLDPGGNEIEKMISEIDKKANARQFCVKVLRIWSHGYLGKGGVQLIGNSELSEETVSTVSDRLCNYFMSGARVELRGCNVAKKGSGGKAMMIALAKKWKVRVQGSEETDFGSAWHSRPWEAKPDGSWRQVDPIQVWERQ